jgi:hypothetical protein
MSMNGNTIVFMKVGRLDGFSAFERCRCGTCAGETDRQAIICETPYSDDGGYRIRVAVCGGCLQTHGRDIDERLRKGAAHFESLAARARGMLGHLKVVRDNTSVHRILDDDDVIKDVVFYPSGRGEFDHPCLLCGDDVSEELMRCDATICFNHEKTMIGGICPACIKEAKHPGLPSYETFIEMTLIGDFLSDHNADWSRKEWRRLMREHYSDDPTYQAVATRFIAMSDSELRGHAIATAEARGWAV